MDYEEVLSIQEIVDIFWLTFLARGKSDCFIIFQIAKAWVKRITDERGYGEQLVEDANAKIYTFGSYRLSVSYRNCHDSRCIALF